jgi:hypothetical protein
LKEVGSNNSFLFLFPIFSTLSAATATLQLLSTEVPSKSTKKASLRSWQVIYICTTKPFYCNITFCICNYRKNMLIAVTILLPLVIGLFDVKASELRGTEGYINEKEFTSCSRGRSYHKLSVNADSRSWSYSDADTGLKGVCSVANKCGPASWSKVNIA